MKTRNGFVSNSSSSSFVLITSKKTMADVAKTLTMPEKKFLKSIIGAGKSIKLDGKEKIVFSGELYSDSVYEEYAEIFPEEEQEMEEVDGCRHKFDRNRMNFCPECGEPRKVEVEGRDTEEQKDAMEVLEDIMAKFDDYSDSYASVGEY